MRRSLSPTLILLVIGQIAIAQTVMAKCPDEGLIPIAELRGTSGESREGERILTRGVVTGDFRGEDALNGFYLQDDGDNPAGIFVYAPDLEPGIPPVAPGREVVVAGQAGKFQGNRQISRVRQVLGCDEPGLPEPVDLALPEAERDGWRAREGMLVRIPEPVTVTGNFDLERFGSLDVAVGGRLFRPTNSPDRENAHHNDARRIVIDDASYSRNPRPVPYLDAEGTRRVGSVIPELSGVLTHAFDAWRIHPLAPEAVEFERTNPRPDAPERQAEMRLAGFNVENYFLTLGERGAADESELERQRRQLAAVAEGLESDLLGLVEVENRPEAVADLAERLGKAAGLSGGYRHFGLEEGVGTDAIRVALAWHPGRVEKLGGPWIDERRVHHRPPVAAHFRMGPEGPGKIVAVIHHKAKTGCPEEGDVDRGQGCWNERRTAQSEALAEFLEEQAGKAGTDRVIILGDINSYGGEDPVLTLTEAGFSDLIREHRAPEERYSYVFHGESGYIDTALSSASLIEDVVDAGFWHINADEPPALHEFDSDSKAGPWRSSDHDPVWVDIEP